MVFKNKKTLAILLTLSALPALSATEEETLLAKIEKSEKQAVNQIKPIEERLSTIFTEHTGTLGGDEIVEFYKLKDLDSIGYTHPRGYGFNAAAIQRETFNLVDVLRTNQAKTWQVLENWQESEHHITTQKTWQSINNNMSKLAHGYIDEAENLLDVPSDIPTSEILKKLQAARTMESLRAEVLAIHRASNTLFSSLWNQRNRLITAKSCYECSLETATTPDSKSSYMNLIDRENEKLQAVETAFGCFDQMIRRLMPYTHYIHGMPSLEYDAFNISNDDATTELGKLRTSLGAFFAAVLPLDLATYASRSVNIVGDGFTTFLSEDRQAEISAAHKAAEEAASQPSKVMLLVLGVSDLVSSSSKDHDESASPLSDLNYDADDEKECTDGGDNPNGSGKKKATVVVDIDDSQATHNQSKEASKQEEETSQLTESPLGALPNSASSNGISLVLDTGINGIVKPFSPTGKPHIPESSAHTVLHTFIPPESPTHTARITEHKKREFHPNFMEPQPTSNTVATSTTNKVSSEVNNPTSSVEESSKTQSLSNIFLRTTNNIRLTRTDLRRTGGTPVPRFLPSSPSRSTSFILPTKIPDDFRGNSSTVKQLNTTAAYFLTSTIREESDSAPYLPNKVAKTVIDNHESMAEKQVERESFQHQEAKLASQIDEERSKLSKAKINLARLIQENHRSQSATQVIAKLRLPELTAKLEETNAEIKALPPRITKKRNQKKLPKSSKQKNTARAKQLKALNQEKEALTTRIADFRVAASEPYTNFLKAQENVSEKIKIITQLEFQLNELRENQSL